jgi:hypothetical protein
MKHVFPISLFTILPLACGSPDASPAEEAPSVEVSATRTIEQAIGEPCKDANWDLLESVSTDGRFSSTINDVFFQTPDGNYGKPTCTHALLVQANILDVRGGTISAVYRGPDVSGTALPCNGEWVRMIIWSDTPGAPKVRIFDQMSQGPPGNFNCPRPDVTYVSDRDGNFLVAVQAGYATVYGPVSFQMHAFPGG